MRASVSIFTALLLASTTLSEAAHAVDRIFRAETTDLRVETFASGLEHPWSLAFLPGGAMLVTERPGRLRLISAAGRVSDPVRGVPKVATGDQGGLLGLALDPAFARNRLIYFSYLEAGRGGNGIAVARARLNTDKPARLTNLKVIFRQRPKAPGAKNVGSRLIFGRDGKLFISIGDFYEDDVRTMAQDLGSDIGKILRINPDGSIPSDNPFVKRAKALPEIWSYGHRNPEGLDLDPQTGVLWENEHGPMGGDEVNIIRPGRNYGWPLVSYGLNYDGTKVGTGRQTMDGVTRPIHYWVPSIAPSGMRFYATDQIPGWKGNLLVTALKDKMLVRLDVQGSRITHEEHLLQDVGMRLRGAEIAPDGAVYIFTDEDKGEILRLTPTE